MIFDIKRKKTFEAEAAAISKDIIFTPLFFDYEIQFCASFSYFCKCVD